MMRASLVNFRNLNLPCKADIYLLFEGFYALFRGSPAPWGLRPGTAAHLQCGGLKGGRPFS